MSVPTPLGRSARVPAADPVPVQVYTPQRLRMPRPGVYLRDLWDRRAFAYELARTDLRAKNVGTMFGQAWLVINPLLLAGVYYLLVNILRDRQRGSEFLAHLMATLFAYTFFSTSVSASAKAVTRSGKLILNTAFPRSLLPISSVMSAFVRFLPTMGVYAAMHLASGQPVSFAMLLALPVLVEIVVFALGVSLLLSAVQVYFRDLANVLPYLLRVWLYISPVLYLTDEVPSALERYLVLNPLYPMLAAWSDALVRAQVPSGADVLQGALWALAALLVGGLFFVSREREFAVRL